MPEIVSCPQCERQLRIPDELLGSSVKCPSCGTTFTGTAPAEPPLTGVIVEDGNRQPAAETAVPRQEFNYRGPGESQPFIRRDSVPHRGVLVLVFGILSLVFLALCGPFAGIFGLAAWILGHHDLAEIRAGLMDRDGEGMTQAGRICGIISVVISVGICALYGFIVAMVVAGG